MANNTCRLGHGRFAPQMLKVWRKITSDCSGRIGSTLVYSWPWSYSFRSQAGHLSRSESRFELLQSNCKQWLDQSLQTGVKLTLWTYQVHSWVGAKMPVLYLIGCGMMGMWSIVCPTMDQDFQHSLLSLCVKKILELIWLKLKFDSLSIILLLHHSRRSKS